MMTDLKGVSVEKQVWSEEVQNTAKGPKGFGTPVAAAMLCCLCLGLAVWGSVMTGLYVSKLGRDGGFVCPEDCLCTVDAFIDALSSTHQGEDAILDHPACVGDNLMGAVISVSSGGELPVDLKWAGRGRRIAFVAGRELLEKALVFGQYDTVSLLETIGYGDNPTLGDNDYYVLVFEKPDDAHRGYWSHLDNTLKTIYGDLAPDVNDAVVALTEESFEGGTDCTSMPVWSPDGVDASMCGQCFQDALLRFEPEDCTGQDADSPLYSIDADCPAEEAFLSTKETGISGCELRAYLYQTQGFFYEYTGYGYTANEYKDPLVPEYWLANRKIAELKNAEFVQLLA